MNYRNRLGDKQMKIDSLQPTLAIANTLPRFKGFYKNRDMQYTNICATTNIIKSFEFFLIIDFWIKFFLKFFRKKSIHNKYPFPIIQLTYIR